VGKTETVRQAFGSAEGLAFLKGHFPGGCASARICGDDTTEGTLTAALALALGLASDAGWKAILVQARDAIAARGKVLLILDDYPQASERSNRCARVIYEDLLGGVDARKETFTCLMVTELEVDVENLGLRVGVHK